MKVSQATISQTPNGEWKIFFHSDKQVERALVGTLENVISELKSIAASHEWHKRSLY